MDLYVPPFFSTAPFICVHAVLVVDRHFTMYSEEEVRLAIPRSCIVYLPQGGYAAKQSVLLTFVSFILCASECTLCRLKL